MLCQCQLEPKRKQLSVFLVNFWNEKNETARKKKAHAFNKQTDSQKTHNTHLDAKVLVIYIVSNEIIVGMLMKKEHIYF